MSNDKIKCIQCHRSYWEMVRENICDVCSEEIYWLKPPYNCYWRLQEDMDKYPHVKEPEICYCDDCCLSQEVNDWHKFCRKINDMP